MPSAACCFGGICCYRWIVVHIARALTLEHLFCILYFIILPIFFPSTAEDPSVTGARRRKLEQTVASLRSRYGDEIVRRARDLEQPTAPPAISTGFGELDRLTGCGGIPQGRLTLLSGRTTSGKLTIAYKTLAHLLQDAAASAVILDLTHSSDPDYLMRCGVRLEALTLARPTSPRQAVNLLLDLLHGGESGAILVDSLPHLMRSRADARYVNGCLAALHRLLLGSSCALMVLDEPQPPWLGWLGWQRSFELEGWAALHLSLSREAWLQRGETLVGYEATARVVKSRWAQGNGQATVSIRFNGAVQAGRSW
jgi:hypothetical protein